MDRLLNGKIPVATKNDVALDNDEIDELLSELDHDWKCINYHHLVKEFSFDDFLNALDFVNKVGEFAEEVNHHPEITFTWGKASVSIYTHTVDGLREADFFYAAQVQQLYG